GTPMTRFTRALTAVFALACLALVLQGCESAEEVAAGTYTLDKESIKASLQKEIDSEGGQGNPMAAAMAQQMIESMTMTLTLDADGTASSNMSMMGQTQNASGTWKIDGDSVSITMAEDGGEPSTATGKLDGDTLEMQPEGGDEMPFKMIFRK